MEKSEEKIDGRKLRSVRKKKITVELKEDLEETLQSHLTIKEIEMLHVKNMQERKLREITIKYYGFMMHNFYGYLSSDTPIYKISPNTVTGYEDYMREKGLAQNTIHTNIKGLKTVLLFAMKEGYLNNFHIKLPPADKEHLKKMYTVEQVQKLIARPVLKDCKFSTVMSWVSCNILAFTGCRARSLVNLKCGDVDFQNNLIYFRHMKGKKPHTVPLPSALVNVLKTYLKIRLANETKESDDKYLICNVYGEQITPSSLYKYLQVYNSEREVDIFSIHAFRRFYITQMVKSNMPISKIMFLVDHHSTEMVNHYCKLYAPDLIEDVEEYSRTLIDTKQNRTRIK